MEEIIQVLLGQHFYLAAALLAANFVQAMALRALWSAFRDDQRSASEQADRRIAAQLRLADEITKLASWFQGRIG